MRPAGRRRVTGEDVAAAAAVSTSVVSLVLNGKDAGRVNEETRERVLSAARRLGYRIDGRGRSLATGRTGIVGFIAPDSPTPFFASLQRGLLSRLNPDYQLMTVVTDLGHAVSEDSINQLLALGPDALIIFALAADRIASFEPTCPVLLLDSPGRDSEFPRINVDVGSSARVLGRHFAEHGHRALVYLDANTGSQSMEERRRALLSAFRRHAAAKVHTAVARCAIDAAVARDIVVRFWPRWVDAGVTAIACGSDLHAFGAIGALRDLGLHVPADVSVSGADDQPLSTVIQPNLTTVRLPTMELGQLAADHVREILDGDQDKARDVVVLPTEAVIRESTGPAPAVASRPTR